MAQFSWPPVSVSTTGLAQDTSVQTVATEIGPTNDTAPASDIATASLNGRLQRIAQRLTSLIALLPSAIGQTTKVGSLSVAVASDQVVPVSGTFWQATQPVSGTVAATQSGTWNIGSITTLPSLAAGAAVIGAVTQSGTWNIGTITTLPSLAAGAAVIGAVTQSGTWNVGTITTLPALATGANTIGAVNQNGTWTVQPGNTANTTAWLVTQDKAATGTITSVAGATSSTTVLASNAARKHATFFNESTAILYLAFASTASTTAYTVQIPASGYYELPSGRIFSGLITGIWSAANGNVRVTELT